MFEIKELRMKTASAVIRPNWQRGMGFPVFLAEALFWETESTHLNVVESKETQELPSSI